MRDSVALYTWEAMQRGGLIAAACPGVRLRSMTARAADEIRDIIVQQF